MTIIWWTKHLNFHWIKENFIIRNKNAWRLLGQLSREIMRRQVGRWKCHGKTNVLGTQWCPPAIIFADTDKSRAAKLSTIYLAICRVGLSVVVVSNDGQSIKEIIQVKQVRKISIIFKYKMFIIQLSEYYCKLSAWE